MHRVQYLLFAYTCDLDNDNFYLMLGNIKHCYVINFTTSFVSLPRILPMTDYINSREAINAIKLFSSGRQQWFFPCDPPQSNAFLGDPAKWKINYFNGRMHKRNSRTRLNVSQYKCNRRATCVHLLHNIRIRFIRKATFKKMHFLCTTPYHGTTLFDIKFDISPE